MQKLGDIIKGPESWVRGYHAADKDGVHCSVTDKKGKQLSDFGCTITAFNDSPITDWKDIEEVIKRFDTQSA